MKTFKRLYVPALEEGEIPYYLEREAEKLCREAGIGKDAAKELLCEMHNWDPKKYVTGL